jgi:uncharacterized protein YjbJ (UPF0337 family)
MNDVPWHYLDGLPKGVPIGWDRWQGLWRQGLGSAVLLMGRLLRSQACTRAGARLQLSGKIQRRYGVAMAEAQRLLEECERRSHDPWYTDLRKRYVPQSSGAPADKRSESSESSTEDLETK